MEKRLTAVVREESGQTVIALNGRLEDAVPGALGRLVDGLPPPGASPVIVDLAGVGRFGGLGAATITTLVGGLEERGWSVRLRVGDDVQRRTLAAYSHDVPAPEEPGDGDIDLVERLGERTLQIQEAMVRYLVLLLAILRHSARQLAGRGGRRAGITVTAVVRMGVNATPLVALISALIGSILALSAAPFLQTYGQEIRVADLVGLAVTKEIGPLLTAILVAGRSGSSLTAEIGTMRVAEEVDALTVMGVDPVGYLVAPRLLAMAVVLPVLTVISDVIAISGGLVTGMAALDLSRAAYIEETLLIVESTHVLGGLLKAFFFGMVIVSVAAHFGFATAGGAAGVGKYTTRSVVFAIIWIIIVDAVFTLVQFLME